MDSARTQRLQYDDVGRIYDSCYDSQTNVRKIRSISARALQSTHSKLPTARTTRGRRPPKTTDSDPKTTNSEKTETTRCGMK